MLGRKVFIVSAKSLDLVYLHSCASWHRSIIWGQLVTMPNFVSITQKCLICSLCVYLGVVFG